MPNTAFEESPQGAARALVEHLRRNPGESRDPAALAARFGLETEFVRRALARLPETGARPVPVRTPHRFAERAGGFLAFLDDALDRAAVNPIRFELFSLLAASAAILGFALLFPNPAGESPMMGLRSGLNGAVLLAVVAAQMAAFYRRRMVRYGLYGGLVFGGGLAVLLMIRTWIALQRGSPLTDLRQGLVVFAVGVFMLLVGILYAGVASLASLAGGWVWMRRDERQWERLTRQELLERYFELGRRLERSVAAPDEPMFWETLPFLAWVRAQPLLAAGLLGVGAGLLQVLLIATFRGDAQNLTDTLALLVMAKNAVAWGLFAGIAFLAGRVARGAACAPPYLAGFLLGVCLPLAGFGPAAALRMVDLSFVANVAAHALLGALMGLGATVQRRSAREARLQRDDGATLVAEMLEIQWRLEEDATSVTVLVVDAAKSTAMKVGADPLDVEYSFREYQMWIAESCAGFGGRIHSVAGDGAVVAFADNAAAMAAARRLQTDVPRFNAALNRLPKPFRLRLGLHAGRVAGDLNDVQFTEVIDIAAHVENIAPVGGIAATAAAVDGLGEGYLPLAHDVDGQPVFIALVPTEG